jgi:hypothetical protein
MNLASIFFVSLTNKKSMVKMALLSTETNGMKDSVTVEKIHFYLLRSRKRDMKKSIHDTREDAVSFQRTGSMSS